MKDTPETESILSYNSISPSLASKAPSISSSKPVNKKIFFTLAGLLALTPCFIEFASADVVEKIYKGYNFSFYCVMPQYISIPFTLLLVKLFDKLKLSMSFKIYFSYISLGIGLLVIPIYTFNLAVSNLSKVEFSNFSLRFLDNYVPLSTSLHLREFITDIHCISSLSL